MTPPRSPETLIRAHTTLARPSLVPELRLHLATELTPIWQATETWLAAHNLAPPYWAFAWPGSQAISRHLLDHPAAARHKRVLDFAAGSGLAALAARRTGATATANDIDPLAIAAIRLNAEANALTLAVLPGDIVGASCRWDLILAGDAFYEAPMAARVLPWLRAMAVEAEVWIADPGRAYLPPTGLTGFATYDVPTTTELEDGQMRRTTLYRLSG